MIRVALIGAGQLGSRHLQALARLPAGSRVTMVEPSEASRSTAQSRWAEVAGQGIAVEFVEGLGQLSGEIDVAIVATTAA
jgi:hypothetical protein